MELTVFQLGQFNGTAEDPDGFISLYEWDFDGDSIFVWYAKTTGTTGHFYSTEGVYKAVFRAVDDNGKVNSTEVTIIVSAIPNNPPIVFAGSNQSAGVGPVTLFATASDPEGNIVEYLWDFDGDGEFDWTSPENMELNHTYDQEGKYRAVFRATDTFGLYAEDTVDIIIDNRIITGRISAIVVVDWNETKSGGSEFDYHIKFNNTFEPGNVTVYISIRSADKIEKRVYPSSLKQLDSRTLFAESSFEGRNGETILIEVLYLDRLIGQREIELTDDFSRRLVSTNVDQNAEYSYSTDIYQESTDTVRQENHTGKLRVISSNQILQNYYSGEGSLKLINEIEGSRTIFNLTSTSIYRNETRENGRLVQDSFQFTGTGRYKFTSAEGASFDIQLSEFVLREQNGNKTDYYFSGSGSYSNPPLSGSIDISYDLLGLDIHDNWNGDFFNCEMYKIETLISYKVSDTKISVHNTSFVWIVSEDESYEDTTIYVEYLFRYSENDFVFEQLTGKYYPKGAPKEVEVAPDIFEAIEFAGVVPISFSEDDRVFIKSDQGMKIRYEGMRKYQLDIKGKTYSVTDINGSVFDSGSGTAKLTIVGSGKYTGWIVLKDEEYSWNDDVYKRRLELI
jgi:hypothetical protein